MALQKLELTNDYNQRTSVSVEVNGELIDLEMFLEYNRMAGYWVVSIKDVKKDEIVISSMPLVLGINLLGQYGYLELGSSGILNTDSNISPDDLNDTNFGTTFWWCWDD
jgi:predicted Zn-dependent protease with MMP-like domain